MQCPVCDNERLQMTDREGIEIDYCPKCRGVWLDRGELDKIIERSAEMVEPAGNPAPPQGARERPDPRDYRQDHRPRYDDDFYKHSKHYKHHKKKGMKYWLKELFD